jgi:hypothetical protein
MSNRRLPTPIEKLTSKTTFIDTVDKLSLKNLSLEELAQRFDDIEQQAQLFQGRILLEARNRFKSDPSFGDWVAKVGGVLCSCGRQHRTKLMNLARFFDGRELDKISVTAAYEISAPVNADVAKDVYEYVKGKNLPVAEVKRQIAIRKAKSESSSLVSIIAPVLGLQPVAPPVLEIKSIAEPEKAESIEQHHEAIPVLEETSDIEQRSNEVDLKSQIMALVKGVRIGDAIRILKECFEELDTKRYGR